MRLETPAEYLRRMRTVRREYLQQLLTEQFCTQQRREPPTTAAQRWARAQQSQKP